MTAFRVALAYFGIGSLWVVGTDWLFVRAPEDLVSFGATLKGLTFVAFGSLILYVFTSREHRERQVTVEDRERLERQLAAMARFEAIGRLTGGIAHDFNNLITAISGNIATYVGQLPERSAPQELDEAQRSADRAAELTKQLLAFGRQQVLRPERVNLNAIVGDMASLLQRLIGSRIRMTFEGAEDLRAVHVDPGRLEQVLMNLVINARDAMPEGGDLTVRTTNVRVSSSRAKRFPFPFVAGEYVRLDVTDTGVGMDKELQTRIFEPFFTTKPKDVGTGLGLATVYGIVKQSGGYITVDSVPGHGATFSVYLPQSGEAADALVATPEPEVEPDEAEDTGTETVLVVEDDAAVRSLVVRILERRGFDVIEAHNGTEALDVLGRSSDGIHLLIADAIMPQMSGMELIDVTRTKAPSVRTLLISGYADLDLDQSVPYLSKPFTPAQLVRTVRRVLDA